MARFPRMATTPTSAAHRRSFVLAAFTLIELLAVIAMIALLAAFAVPAVNSAMANAQSAEGISNLRQIGQLIALYSTDHGGLLPPQRDWGSTGGDPANFSFFQNYLRLSANLPTVGQEFFASPWLPEIFYDPTVGKGPQHPWGSFGVNDEIILSANRCNVKYGQPNGIPLAAINRPAHKVIVCSARDSQNSYWKSSWYFSGMGWVNNGAAHPGPSPDPRHGGRTASLFADFHVELLDTDSMTQAQRKDYFLLDP
jgi:prepilin-type N-terminal cleavage/methylation domain-containing protein/prepilin-type processing-associated H-X9-DG protein